MGLLKIIDPITNRLMSSSCIEYTNIKIEFKRISRELESWREQIEEELKTGGVSPADLLRLGGSRKSIEKWLNRFEGKHPVSLQKVI